MTNDADSSATDTSPTPTASGANRLVGLAALALAVPVVIILCLLFAVVPGVWWWLGIPVGIVIAAVVVLLRQRRAADILLSSLAAAPADPDRHTRLHNLVEGLSLAGGVPEPELFVVDDEGRNAAAVAQGDRSAIVVSSGLLDAIDRVALEGVVAEALVRIRSGDAEAATLGSALFGGLLAGPLASLGKPAATLGLRQLLADDRDLEADRAAVALTRYPPGLLSALDVIRSGSPRVAAASAANDYVWLVPPSAVEASTEAVIDPSPLDLRIDVLGEL